MWLLEDFKLPMWFTLYFYWTPAGIVGVSKLHATVFVNKALLVHSCAHMLFKGHPRPLCASIVVLSNHDEDIWLTKPNTFTSWPFKENKNTDPLV